MINANEFVNMFGKKDEKKLIKFAKVHDEDCRLIFDGETIPTVKAYPHVEGYTPKEHDRVMVLHGTVMGKIGIASQPAGNVSNFTATAGNAEITLTWQDPNDTLDDENNVVGKWAGTKIIRKVGSYPVNAKDGVLVVDSTVKNQYESSGYVDDGLTNDTEYFYMAFPYTDKGLVTVDSANRVSAIPSDVDDPTNAPGPKQLIAGGMDAGFFGEVSTSELFTGSEIASECGISQGTLQFKDEPWLKFAYEGKILFRPRKSIRHSISWNALNEADCIYGSKQISKNEINYKVRLMRGTLTDPANYNNPDRGAIGSEWNKLMLPIHEQAINKSWTYPQYAGDNIPVWSHQFGTGVNGMYTDSDLRVDSGDGRVNWNQENHYASNRMHRGNINVTNIGSGSSQGTSSVYGWVPVLEVVE